VRAAKAQQAASLAAAAADPPVDVGSPSFGAAGIGGSSAAIAAIGDKAEAAAKPAAAGSTLSPAAALALRDRRLHLRAQAVSHLADGRPRDALSAAFDAYEVFERCQKAGGGGDQWQVGSPEVEAAVLVELMVIVRCAHVTEDFAMGLGFLETLTAAVDRLAGVHSHLPLFHPCAAATLLYTASELCSVYGHEERAEQYARHYLSMAKLAHGEGSPAAGDAHAFLSALLAKRGCFDEALQQAGRLLDARQRGSVSGMDRSIADAHWNIAILQSQLGQHHAALDSMHEARDIHLRLSGEGAETANIDVAASKLHQILGEHKKAVRALRWAVRTRQRALGFASYGTRQAADMLAKLETEVHHLMNDDEASPLAHFGGQEDMEAVAAAAAGTPEQQQLQLQLQQEQPGGTSEVARPPTPVGGSPSLRQGSTTMSGAAPVAAARRPSRNR